MGKDEFLRRLEEALSGAVPPNIIRENLIYYKDYIEGEVQKGLTQQEVIEGIGDPRLIARTIIDATPGAGEPGAFEDTYRTDSGAYGSWGESLHQNRSDGARIHHYNKWYWKLLFAVAVILVIWAILAIIGGIFSLLLPLLPIIILAYVIMTVIRNIRR